MDGATELAAQKAAWAALGKHVRCLRQEQGLTQVVLSKSATVSVATIRSIETNPGERRHAARTLKLLSQGLGEEDDYLANYLKNPPAEDPGRESEGMSAPAPPRSRLDLVARIDEILVRRLEEIVMPRLKEMEEQVGQVRGLVDIIYKTTGPKVETDEEQSSDPE